MERNFHYQLVNLHAEHWLPVGADVVYDSYDDANGMGEETSNEFTEFDVGVVCVETGTLMDAYRDGWHMNGPAWLDRYFVPVRRQAQRR